MQPLGWVVLRSGSLWLVCGYHAGWNLAASILLGMRDSGLSAPGSLFTTILSGPTWLSGGAGRVDAAIERRGRSPGLEPHGWGGGRRPRTLCLGRTRCGEDEASDQRGKSG